MREEMENMKVTIQNNNSIRQEQESSSILNDLSFSDERVKVLEVRQSLLSNNNHDRHYF
jgi:hypothetical protein